MDCLESPKAVFQYKLIKYQKENNHNSSDVAMCINNTTWK